MTKVTFYRNQKSGRYIGFRAEDHAGFAAAGEDIVCAAISALTINTCNSIEALTQDPVQVSVSEQKTLIELKTDDSPSQGCVLLIQSLELGLREIAEAYSGHLQIAYMEV